LILYAPWCEYSRLFLAHYPSLVTLVRLFNRDIKVATVNVDAEERLITRFDLESFPVLFYIEDGTVRRYDEALSNKAVVEWFESGNYKKAPLREGMNNPFGWQRIAMGHARLCIAKVYRFFRDTAGQMKLDVPVLTAIVAGVAATGFAVALCIFVVKNAENLVSDIPETSEKKPEKKPKKKEEKKEKKTENKPKKKVEEEEKPAPAPAPEPEPEPEEEEEEEEEVVEEEEQVEEKKEEEEEEKPKEEEKKEEEEPKEEVKEEKPKEEPEEEKPTGQVISVDSKKPKPASGGLRNRKRKV